MYSIILQRGSEFGVPEAEPNCAEPVGDRHPEMQGGRGKTTRNVQTTTKDVPTAKSGTGE